LPQTRLRRLALTQIELKECRDALQTLTTLYPRLTEAERPEAVSAGAPRSVPAWLRAARWWAESLVLPMMSHR
jgi:hypothetical protein